MPSPAEPVPSPELAGAGVWDDLYAAALANLRGNTVELEGADVLRAGGAYPQPWTRDAAINSWSSASLTDPALAAATLGAVTERIPAPDATGDAASVEVVQQDEQWWDRIVWVIAAQRHALATGDVAWFRRAWRTGRATLELLTAERRRDDGLYTGPAFLQDGIAGYPDRFEDPEVAARSSFVLDHPGTDELVCLSTNALYVGALRALADCGRMLAAHDSDRQRERRGPGAGRDEKSQGDGERESDEDAPREPATSLLVAATAFDEQATRLAAALRTALRVADPESTPAPATGWAYLSHPETGIEPYDEAAGVAFAVLLGVVDRDEGAAMLAALPRLPRGAVLVHPHAGRFDDEHPARHGVICWPMVTGLVIEADGAVGRLDLLERDLADLARLLGDGSAPLYELYDAEDGHVTGGWQCGHEWESVVDQTWSATAVLRAVHAGVLGIRATADGVRFAPTVPSGFDGCRLTGLRLGGASVDVTVSGSGTRLAQVVVDRVEVDPGGMHLPADGRPHHVELVVA